MSTTLAPQFQSQPTSLKPTSLAVRRATNADATSVAEIYNRYVGLGTATLETRPWSASSVSAWLDNAGERQVMLVVEDGNQVVGWGQIKQYSDRGGYRFTCEIAEYLDPAATGRGAGKLLMSKLLQFAEDASYRHIVAKIIASNVGSISFHQKHGFTTVGTQIGIGEACGQEIDVTIMQRLSCDQAS